MGSMSSKSSHMKRLNGLSCIIYDYKKNPFKSSQTVTSKLCDASDYGID